MSRPLEAPESRPLDGGPSFSLGNRLTRLAFLIAWSLACRYTPRQFNRWRVFVLRFFGATIASSATVYGSARIWLPSNLVIEDHATLGPGVECYTMARITIGRGAIISQRAFLCTGTHDYRDPHFQLYARPITISAQAWVAAEAFVGPGVCIGEGAVLGARSAAFADLEPWCVYSGNPAARVSTRSVVSPSRGVNSDKS